MNILEVLKRNRTAIVASAVLNLTILGGAGLLAYEHRAFLFEQFASEYAARYAPGGALASNIFADETLITDLIERVNPAVVSIVVTKDLPVLREFNFFGLPFTVPNEGSIEREVGGGSGFFVSADGLIVTNKHVVSDEDASYTVLTKDGESYDATVVARDPSLDVAVLDIEGNDFPRLLFGNSEALKLGQTVIAIGNALGEFRNSVSVGIVSGLSRSVAAGNRFGQTELLDEVIQTDAAINPGNSGGPLLDMQGRVIGVNVAVALGSENIGFALPSNEVQNVVESVKEHGEIVRPYLGVRYVEVTPQIAAQNNLPVERGIWILRDSAVPSVLANSPAQDAGLRPGDIILEFDGVMLDEEHSLAQIVRNKKVGDTVSMKIVRDGNELTLETTLARTPDNFR